VAGMASVLQVVARNNPVTHWCNLARYLALGDAGLLDPGTQQQIGTFGPLLLMSTLWIVGLLLVFVPLAVWLYRRLT
jgi:hypothetical protein